MLRHVGLDEDDAPLRVDAAGDELGVQLQRLAAQGRRVLPDGDGMLVGHAVQGVVVVLERGPIAQSAEVVAQGDLAAGLGGAENDFFIRIHLWSPLRSFHAAHLGTA